MHAVRFELTRVAPPDLETGALDRSAKHAFSALSALRLPLNHYNLIIIKMQEEVKTPLMGRTSTQYPSEIDSILKARLNNNLPY